MRKPVIITEFSSNGLLDGIIKMKRNGCAQQDWDDTNIYWIAAGMAYLCSLNIIHRDLKPANVLLDEFIYPRVADFGLSKKLSEKITGKKQELKRVFKGTYAYCAHEIIKKQNYTTKGVYAFVYVVSFQRL